jgi:hypothetical protein
VGSTKDLGVCQLKYLSKTNNESPSLNVFSDVLMGQIKRKCYVSYGIPQSYFQLTKNIKYNENDTTKTY